MLLKSDEKSVLDVFEVMVLDMEIFVYFFQFDIYVIYLRI